MQFAACITFHILFPTISIAMGWTLLFFRLRWLKTHDEAWLMAYRFWTKVFALTFALGVVSGATESLAVILIGCAITVPAIVGYTVFSYRVFWGKAEALNYAWAAFTRPPSRGTS